MFTGHHGTPRDTCGQGGCPVDWANKYGGFSNIRDTRTPIAGHQFYKRVFRSNVLLGPGKERFKNISMVDLAPGVP